MQLAAPLLCDLGDEKAVIRGLLYLSDSLRRKDDVQRVSNELLRLYHELMELPESSRSPVVLTMLLQRFTEYCKLFGLAARVHIGTGAPFSSITLLLQSVPVPVLAAALELVAELCLYQDFWAALDSTDATAVIRQVDSGDVSIRSGALKFLLVALAPAIGSDEARQKLRAVCVANQLRPRLVALLRREVLPELQQTAAELLTRLVLGDEPLAPAAKPAASSLTMLSPSPKKLMGGNAGVPTNARTVKSHPTLPHHASPLQHQQQPQLQQSDRPVSMCEDFVALLSCVGPVALRATQVLADVVASGGETVARDLLHQRGVERLVALLFDLSDAERCSADWSVKSRKYAMKALELAMKNDVGCVECFVDCSGMECAALMLDSNVRAEQEFGAVCLDLCWTRVPRVQHYIEAVLLGGDVASATSAAALPRPSVSAPEGNGAANGSGGGSAGFRMHLETCKGVPNNASRALRGATASSSESAGGTALCNLKDCARVLHACCYWSKQQCPTADVLRKEVRDNVDDQTRGQMLQLRLAHEQKLLQLDLEAERERRMAETRVAVELSERSARIRSEAERDRRALLATAEAEAAKERAKALLELEVAAVGRRWEAEKDSRLNTLRQDGERRVEEMRVQISQLTQTVRELKETQARNVDQIASQNALIEQLSKVSQMLFKDEAQ